MKLGKLHQIFSKLTDDDFIFKSSFGTPFSYRGHYEEVAFDCTYEKCSLAEIKIRIERALTETFNGYKGGEFKFDNHTIAHSACYGECRDESEEILENLVGQMLFEYLCESSDIF